MKFRSFKTKVEIIWKLLKLILKIRNLSFYEYNPKCEDYISGIFYSTMIFKFFEARFKQKLQQIRQK